MPELLRRLRDLNHKQFEQLCYDLVLARHPTANIHHIEGSGGDGGIDLFAGDLTHGSTIWQCKAFTDRIKTPQYQQIRASLDQAIASSHPARWTLCVNLDLTRQNHQWIQKLAREYEARVTIAVYDASAIQHDLRSYQTIRDQYFPLLSDATYLALARQAATKDYATPNDLGRIAAANVQEYLSTLQSNDPRFTYHLTHTRDTSAKPVPPPETICTITSPEHTIHVIPRDSKALADNPLTWNFQLTTTGANKWDQYQRTGEPTTLTSDDLRGYEAPFPHLAPTTNTHPQLILQQRNNNTLDLRVTFGKGKHKDVYDLITFHQTRVGTEELQFVTKDFPLTMTLTFKGPGSARLAFTERLEGCRSNAALRALRALHTAIRTHTIEFYDLRQSKRLLRAPLEGTVPAWLPALLNLANDIQKVSDHYGLSITYPATITEQDERTIRILTDLISGITIHADHLTLTVCKAVSEAPLSLPAHGSFACTTPAFNAPLTLFGQVISTGPVNVTIAQASITNYAETVEFFGSAPPGSSLTIQLRVDGTTTLKSAACNPTLRSPRSGR